MYWVADVAGGIIGVLTYDLLAKPRLVVSAARNALASEPELAKTTA